MTAQCRAVAGPDIPHLEECRVANTSYLDKEGMKCIQRHATGRTLQEEVLFTTLAQQRQMSDVEVTVFPLHPH